MKRVFSAILVLAMVLSLTVAAFAADLQTAGSITGSVTPEIEEATVILKDGTEVELTKAQIDDCIRITSHEEAEEVMQKLREQYPKLTEEELAKYTCENSWTYEENTTLVELFKVAEAAKTPLSYMKAHAANEEDAKEIIQNAIKALGLEEDEKAEEKVDAYAMAIIFDIKVNLEKLAKYINVNKDDIEGLIVKLASDYVDEASEVFFQRDYVPFDKYTELVNEDLTVNIDKEDIYFFDGESSETPKSGYVKTKLDITLDGPFTLFVHQPEEEAK